MEMRMQMFALAIAVVTMLITLGQLIVAIKALDRKKTTEKKSWNLHTFAAVTLTLAMFFFLGYGIYQFRIAPTVNKSSVYMLVAYSVSASFCASMFVFIRMTKYIKDLYAKLDRSFEHLERWGGDVDAFMAAVDRHLTAQSAVARSEREAEDPPAG